VNGGTEWNGWALRARGLFVRGGARAVVSGLDHDFENGGIHWVTGPNGAGKSTFLRVLAGVSSPAEGIVAISPPAEGSPAPVRRYYHPDMRLPPEIRAWDWIRFIAPRKEGGGPDGLLPPHLNSRTRIRDISTGEEKRLVLWSILASRGDILVLDEPFEHLSAEAKGELTLALDGRARRSVVVVATNQAVPEGMVPGSLLALGEALTGVNPS